MMVNNSPHSSSLISSEILDELCTRFLMNLPEQERSDPIRVCFQIELAHWFYLDFYAKPENPENKNVGIREFIRIMYTHCPFLKHLSGNVDGIVDRWRQYKTGVPTYGAILLDNSMQYVLLVQGYYAKSSWGFPKGKVNEEEPADQCAVREVKEEVGFDISSLIRPKDFLERVLNDTTIRLYIVPGVPMDFEFVPRTRNEIGKIQWFKLANLPRHKNDQSKAAIGHFPNHFFMVIPFLEPLFDWISRKHNHQLMLASRTINNANNRFQFQQQRRHTKSVGGGTAETGNVYADSGEIGSFDRNYGSQHAFTDYHYQLHQTTTGNLGGRSEGASMPRAWFGGGSKPFRPPRLQATAFRSPQFPHKTVGSGGGERGPPFSTAMIRAPFVSTNTLRGAGAFGAAATASAFVKHDGGGGGGGRRRGGEQRGTGYQHYSPSRTSGAAGGGRGQQLPNRKLEFVSSHPQHLHQQHDKRQQHFNSSDAAGYKADADAAVTEAEEQKPFVLGLIYPCKAWQNFRFNYSKILS